MKKFIFIIICFFLASKTFSQDKIYKVNGNVIKGKVLEVGVDEIKYKLPDSTDSPIYVADKSTIDKIVYANGRVEKFTLGFKDPENYEGELSKGIKINFLSPMLGFTQFSFEKSITPLKSYEVGLGIIGAGKNYELGNYYINGINTAYKRSAFGLFFDGGYKFNKLPDFIRRGTKKTHLMQGTYAKPTATFGFYSDHVLDYKTGNPVLEKRNVVFGALILNLGHQWVLGDKFLLDIYSGLGYVFDNLGPVDDAYFDNGAENHFVVQKFGQGATIGVSGGIRIGILIK